MTTLKLIGYWREKEAFTKPYNPSTMIQKGGIVDPDYWRDPSTDIYPWPGHLIDNTWWNIHPNETKEKVIAYLENGIPCNYYRGFSGCRLCEETLSSFERSDGVWCWPNKFEHYIRVHGIRIPEKFLEDILLGRNIDLKENFSCGSIPVDPSDWITWSH